MPVRKPIGAVVKLRVLAIVGWILAAGLSIYGLAGGFTRDLPPDPCRVSGPAKDDFCGSPPGPFPVPPTGLWWWIGAAGAALAVAGLIAATFVRAGSHDRMTSRAVPAPLDFPLPLRRPPDGAGGAGDGRSLRTVEVIDAELEAMRRRDWIAESFGSGRAAAFVRQAQQDRLTAVQALMRLRGEMFDFSDINELRELANELTRLDEAGAILTRELTEDILHRLLGAEVG